AQAQLAHPPRPGEDRRHSCRSRRADPRRHGDGGEGRVAMRHALALAFALLPLAALAEVAEPEGFREDDYRAPVPATLAGATVVDAEAAHALWQAGEVAFVDVLPRAPKPEGLPEGTIWREKPRHSI